MCKNNVKTSDMKGNTGNNNKIIKSTKLGATIKILRVTNKILRARITIIKKLFNI